MSNDRWCLALALLTINLIMFHRVESERLLGGWKSNRDQNLKEQMLDLVRHQLFQSYKIRSNSIDILQFERQLVAGTNLRLVVRVDQRIQCELKAFQPLPHTRRPIETTFFYCRKE